MNKRIDWDRNFECIREQIQDQCLQANVEAEILNGT